MERNKTLYRTCKGDLPQSSAGRTSPQSLNNKRVTTAFILSPYDRTLNATPPGGFYTNQDNRDCLFISLRKVTSLDSRFPGGWTKITWQGG